MTDRRMFSVMAGATAVVLGSQFVYSPVFAENPVNISIVELVDDGSGGYRPWEDITGAMPGETYSAIPRVRNDGSVEVDVRMCLSESATNRAGETIGLMANTFGLVIGGDWSLDTTVASNPGDPAAGNCYNYGKKLAVGEVTEPLFSSVTLSRELGNEYKNSTFNLHLDAEATGDVGPTPPSPVDPDTPDAPEDVNPESPDTGANTFSYLANISPVLISLGGIILFATIAYALHGLKK